MEKREPYWDYMGRRLRESRTMTTREDLMKKDIAEMQKSIHGLQMRIKALRESVYDLTYKVNLLGGDPNQMEMKF
tara:strand:- start:348 stop:572 length:225 start_codon:yes stop_codon:yes gene_type:complete